MNKILRNIRLWFVGFFYGMRGADETMLRQINNGDETSVDHHIQTDNLMNDFLQENETQRVKETRDAYYRLLFEADKYSVKITYDADGEISGAEAYRNNGKWITPSTDVYKSDDGLKVRVIQDNEIIQKELSIITDVNYRETAEIYNELLKKNPLDYITLLEIDRGEESPRFRLEKYVRKMVIKERTKTTAKIELYVSQYQEQFNKIHALFLRELHNIMESKDYVTDLFNIEHLGFVTNGRAWGASPAAVFSYKKIRFDKIEEFDGNYVISLIGTIIKDGENVGEKYRTKELDEKYEKKAPKKDDVDLFAAKRQIEKEEKKIDFDTTTLKLS